MSAINLTTGVERVDITFSAGGPAGPAGPTGPIGPAGPAGGSGRHPFTFSGDLFPVGGEYPPDPDVAACMRKITPYEAVIDYPDNIEARGVTHQEVFEAARNLFGRGGTPVMETAQKWAHGVIYLQTGRYKINREIEWPGRLCLEGASVMTHGNTGTDLIAHESWEGNQDDFMFRLIPTDDNYNANFTQWFRNIGVTMVSRCNGILWGGAQTSGIINCQFDSPYEVAIHLGNGMNSFAVRDVNIGAGSGSAITGIRTEANCNNALFENVTIAGSGVHTGFDLTGGRGCQVINSCYCESNIRPVVKESQGLLHVNGLHCKKPRPDPDNGNERRILTIGPSTRFFGTGTVREADSATYAHDDGTSNQLTPSVGTNNFSGWQYES